jgi:hypothetical protein
MSNEAAAVVKAAVEAALSGSGQSWLCVEQA